MPDKVQAPVEPKSTEQSETSESLLSKAQDEMAENNAKALAPDVEELLEETSETSEAEAESLPVEEKKDEEDDISSLLKPEEKKDNVQKRIDRLTAELKALKEENQTLKNVDAVKKGKEPEYSEVQLRTAMKKAMEEGDSDLVFEIMEYQKKKTEESLIKRYEEAEQAKVQAARQVEQEWHGIRNDFSYLADPAEPEYYRGSRNDLDISREDSLLYRLANSLFLSEDDTGRKKYFVPGGQRLAVADALAIILRKKGLNPQDKEKGKLKRQLTREKMKTSLGGANVMAEEKAPKKSSPKSEFDEYIAERRKFRQDRGGF